MGSKMPGRMILALLEKIAAHSLCLYILCWLTIFAFAGMEFFPKELPPHIFPELPLLAGHGPPVAFTMAVAGAIVVWQIGEFLRSSLIQKNRVGFSFLVWIASVLLSATLLAGSGDPAVEELATSMFLSLGAPDLLSKTENLGTLLWLGGFLWVIVAFGSIFVSPVSRKSAAVSPVKSDWVGALGLAQITAAILLALGVRWHVRIPTRVTPAEAVPDPWELLSREEIKVALVFVAVFSVVGVAVEIMSYLADKRAFLMVYSSLRFAAFPIIFYLLLGSWGPYLASGWAQLTGRLTNPAAVLFLLGSSATCLVLWRYSQPHFSSEGDSRWVFVLGIVASFAFWIALAAIGKRWCPKEWSYLEPKGVPYALVGTFRSPWATHSSPRATAAPVEKREPDPMKSACRGWPWGQQENSLLPWTRYCMLSEKWVMLSVNRGHARGDKLLGELALITRKHTSTFLTPKGCVKGLHFEGLVVGGGAVSITELNSTVDRLVFPVWLSEKHLGAHFSRCVVRDLSPDYAWVLVQCYQPSLSGPRWYLVELSSGNFSLIGAGYGEGHFVGHSQALPRAYIKNSVAR